jgi:hypothetical protein
MRCAICGLQVDSIDDAVEEGWTPYFYEGTELHDVACPSCTETLLRHGERGEMEVKQQFRGKLRYLAERQNEAWQDHSQVVMVVLENEPGKLN